MAETTGYQKSNYPLPVYNFRVTLEGIAMSFSEVSGITLEYQTVTYRHGFSAQEGERIEKYYYEKYVPVTLKKGTVHTPLKKGGEQRIDSIYKWVKDNSRRPGVMEVSLCDEQGVPVVSWRIGKAVAVKLQAPTFDAGSNEVAIESLEIMAANISIEHHSPDVSD